MDLQCRCGQYRVRLQAFPRGTPGRLVCYCIDCQAYLRHLGRTDLLDANGGTEVIPAYPADVQTLGGQAQLKCTRLSPNGTFRFSTACCNTPVANTRPGAPWAGFLREMYVAGGNAALADQQLGPVRARIMGRYAKGTPPPGTADRIDLKGMLAVAPFMLKGKLFRKAQPSPFFGPDGVTPVVVPYVLTKDEARACRS